MKPTWESPNGKVQLYLGDNVEVLQTLPKKSVQCIVTSPPYWGLRDYQTAEWEGGDPNCDHKVPLSVKGGNAVGTKQTTNVGSYGYREWLVCGKCGATRVDKQLGLERVPDCLGWATGNPCGECYVCKTVAWAREARRVLRDDGVMWLVIGDSYNSGGAGKNPGGFQGEHMRANPEMDKAYLRHDVKKVYDGLKQKDLVGIPWSVAFALRADGWWLRSDVVWAKGVSFCPDYSGSVMPECLAVDTKVFIRRNGWVSQVTLAQLAKLPELPEILSPNGWVQVKKVWHTRKPAMSMAASKVERLICSPDHRFPVSSDRRRRRVRLERAADIRHEGYADYLLYCPIAPFLTPIVTTWMGRDLDYEFGFLIGAYVAEGGQAERGFGIKLTIGAHEEQFAAHLQSTAAIYGLTFTEAKYEHYLDMKLSSEWFTDILRAFVSGQVKTKALNMELILNTPQVFRQGILDGYIEGDGSQRDSGGWIATSASSRLRDDMATLASSLGIITSKGERNVFDNRTGQAYHGYSLWTPYIRKRKTKSGTDGIFQVPPRSRHDLGEEREMIDLEVDGGVFLVSDGLITHNSVTDRPTKSHEYAFLFSKSKQYYWDQEAVREAPADPQRTNFSHGPKLDCSRNDTDRMDFGGGTSRNIRTVWTINPEPYKGAHFAVFPQKLISPMIKLSTSSRGCCPTCGTAWERVVEKVKPDRGKPCNREKFQAVDYPGSPMYRNGTHNSGIEEGAFYIKETAGWRPGCACYPRAREWKEYISYKDEDNPTPDELAENERIGTLRAELIEVYKPYETVPCTVLDPFGGSGTTAYVANKLGRKSILCDLNPKYIDMQIERVEKDTMTFRVFDLPGMEGMV